VADGLDVVAVGVEHERAVVAAVILGALARRAVVPVAGLGQDAPELVDVVVRRRSERDVQAGRGRTVAARLLDRELLPLREALFLVERAVELDRGERQAVEALRLGEIRDVDRAVVDQRRR
jgi:hypothetical protein